MTKKKIAKKKKAKIDPANTTANLLRKARTSARELRTTLTKVHHYPGLAFLASMVLTHIEQVIDDDNWDDFD